MVPQVIRGKARFVAALVTVAALGGCRDAPPQPAGEAAASDATYVAPPSVIEATPAAGVVVLSGAAAPNANVRLAEPTGGVLDARADSEGRWKLQLPVHDDGRIYGLSAESAGRRVQAQGYVLVAPGGGTALLRAGAGALRLDRTAGARIAAVDFDADGGALLSGWAPARTDVAVRLDGRTLGEARAGADGRFAYALPRLAQGLRRIETTGVGFVDVVQVEVTPPGPLTSGPLLVRPLARGLRADWLTPGGGVQSTVLTG